jgi:hypothetical protein
VEENENDSTDQSELEGTNPVQAFTTRAIPTNAADHGPRLGRPARVVPGERSEEEMS